MLLKRDQHEPAKPLRSSKRGGIASLTPRDTLSQKKRIAKKVCRSTNNSSFRNTLINAFSRLLKFFFAFDVQTLLLFRARVNKCQFTSKVN